MPSLEIKPTSIVLFPTPADRTTLTNVHQQYYLSPPLTPFPHFPSYNDNPEHTSPALPSYHPSLPALQEMLPHENSQANSATDEERFRLHSALQEHPERGRKEIMEHHSVTTYRSGQHMTDPARILPLYTTQPHNTAPPASTISPLLRRNKAHVASACVNCKKAHLACDGKLPPLILPCYVYLWICGSPVLPLHGCNPLRQNVDACQPAAARRAHIFGLFPFLFVFLFWLFLYSCFVWLLNWNGRRGEGPVSGKALSSIEPILRFLAGHASENILNRADPPIKRTILAYKASVA